MIDTGIHIIKFADAKDLDRIIEFIKNYWNPGHIFVRNVEFFKYEFFYEDRINFVIAENKNSSEIDGLVGFIKYTKNYEDTDLFGAIWKVKNKTGDPFLGVKLLNFIPKNIPLRTFSGCGANEKTIPIHRFLGYKTGKLDHYYILNDRIKNYKIAVVLKDSKCNITYDKEQYKLLKIDDIYHLKKLFPVEQYKNRKPYKDEWYINRRYFQHPTYKYDVWGIDKNGGIHSIIISREICCQGAKVLRIVDFIGIDNDLEGISKELFKIIYGNNYEYVDFYVYGIENRIIKNIGFSLQQGDEDIIIPNYFEPFEQRNIDIYFFTSEKGQFYMFKADGDQDRPNLNYQ